MIIDIKEKLNQLIEINRGLVNDLDISRSVIAKLGREHDTLLEQVEGLRKENRDLQDKYMKCEQQYLPDQFQPQMLQDQQKVDEIRYELELAWQRVDQEKERAEHYEARVDALTRHLCEFAREHDEVLIQLDESETALNEIRNHLKSSLDEEISYYL